MGTRRIFGFIAASLLATAAFGQRMQIPFAEPVELAVAPGSTHFDAFGRRFRISLQDNDRLLKSITGSGKAKLSSPPLLRGRVDGVADSWVRLSRVSGGLEGAIWDGREMYVVTSYRQVSPWLSRPMEVAPTQTVVYRLSDVIDALPSRIAARRNRSPEAASWKPGLPASL